MSKTICDICHDPSTITEDGGTCDYCSLIARLSAAEKERDSLESKLAVATDALRSIAAEHRPGQSTTEYWSSVPKAQCAEVLATDTDIAREALKAINGGES